MNLSDVLNDSRDSSTCVNIPYMRYKNFYKIYV